MTVLATTRPDNEPAQRDPRDPELRLAELLDPDSVVALRPRDDSGVFAARGRIGGGDRRADCRDAAERESGGGGKRVNLGGRPIN